MNEPIQLIRDFLERRWSTFQQDADSIAFQYLSGSIPFNCYLEFNPHMQALLFRAILSQPVPIECREAMVSLCNVINWSTPNGCLALDTRTGDLRWKFGLYLHRQSMTESHVRSVVEPSVCLLDSYVLAVVAVFAGNSLASAVARIGEDPGIGTSETCHYSLEPHPRNVA